MLTPDKVHVKAADATREPVRCPECDPKKPGRTWRETTQGVAVGVCEYHGMFELPSEKPAHAR